MSIRSASCGRALSTCLAQPPKAPNVEAQRAAMKKLDFLLGKWSGECTCAARAGRTLELTQTEEVQYKLDGLVLLIEGTGRNKSDGKVVFRALATVAYDEDAQPIASARTTTAVISRPISSSPKPERASPGASRSAR